MIKWYPCDNKLTFKSPGIFDLNAKSSFIDKNIKFRSIYTMSVVLKLYKNIDIQIVKKKQNKN